MVHARVRGARKKPEAKWQNRSVHGGYAYVGRPQKQKRISTKWGRANGSQSEVQTTNRRGGGFAGRGSEESREAISGFQPPHEVGKIVKRSAQSPVQRCSGCNSRCGWVHADCGCERRRRRR